MIVRLKTSLPPRFAIGIFFAWTPEMLDKNPLLIYEITNGCEQAHGSAVRAPIPFEVLSWQFKNVFQGEGLQAAPPGFRDVWAENGFLIFLMPLNPLEAAVQVG